MLVDARVLGLKAEQKRVTANKVSFNFGTFPKVTVQAGLTLVPEARLDVVDPKAISSSFEDNKIYIVIFLTILFTKVSG